MNVQMITFKHTPFHTYWGLGETFLIVNVLNPHFFFHFNNGVEASSMNMNFVFLYCKQRSGFLVFSGINFSGSVIRVQTLLLSLNKNFKKQYCTQKQSIHVHGIINSKACCLIPQQES